MSEHVDIRIEGRAGRITLNKPKALNALDHEMVTAISAALAEWADDPAVALVLIDGAGERAFCAGADLKRIHAAGMSGDYAPGHRFFVDEYAMNAAIAHFPKPYVALMDGIVMGGGVGLSAHGSHRVVTERTMLAMPECGIGLVPDVGVTKFLAAAPGRLGEYVGLTGARFGAADAIALGFAGICTSSEKLPEIARLLCESGDAKVIYGFEGDPDQSTLEPHRGLIDRCFSGESVADILAALDAQTDGFAAEAAALIRKGSPLSLAATLQIVRAVREDPTIERALAEEHKFTHRAQEFGDFQEGIRAVVVDKDRNPRWPDRIDDLPPARLERMRADVGT